MPKPVYKKTKGAKVAKPSPKKVKCIACGGTGRASNGGPCEPCRRRKLENL